MKYYKVPVYKAVPCNTKPFVDIESLGETVVAKSRYSGIAVEPNTEVEIPIQTSKYTTRGLIKMNQNQIAQHGFFLFVYQSQLTDKNQVTEEYFNQWLVNSDDSKVYQCCQEMFVSDSKPTYEKTRKKRRR